MFTDCLLQKQNCKKCRLNYSTVQTLECNYVRSRIFTDTADSLTDKNWPYTTASRKCVDNDRYAKNDNRTPKKYANKWYFADNRNTVIVVRYDHKTRLLTGPIVCWYFVGSRYDQGRWRCNTIAYPDLRLAGRTTDIMPNSTTAAICCQKYKLLQASTKLSVII